MLDRLRSLSEFAAETESPDAIAWEALSALEDVLRVERAAVLLVDADGVMRFEASKGLSDAFRSEIEGLSPWEADDVDPPPFVVEDVETHPLGVRYGGLLRGEGVRAIAFIPLVHRKAIVGRFVLCHDRPHVFTEEEISLCRLIASHVAFAIERRRDERRLETQDLVLRALVDADSLAEGARSALRVICERLGWPIGALWRVDTGEGRLRCVALWRDPEWTAEAFETMTRESAFERGVGLPGRIWQTGRPAWIRDVVDDPNFPRAPFAAREGLHAGFGFPISVAGAVVAVMEFFDSEIREPDEDLLDMMATIGRQLGELVRRQETNEALQISEARKGAVVTAAADALVMIDEVGRIVEFNAAAERLFGHRREDVLARPMADVIVPPSLRPRHLESFRRHLETGETTIIGRRVELAALRADGSEIPVEVTIQRVEGPGRQFIGFIRDITGRRQREQDLHLLAEAGATLGRSLDYEQTLRQLAELVVPRLGDWCAVYEPEPDGSIRRLAMVPADPDDRPLAERIQRHRLRPDAPTGVPHVLRSGRLLFEPDVPLDLLTDDVDEPGELAKLVAPLDIRSWICIPLVARGRTVGAISFMYGKSGRRHTEADLALAQELCRTASLAVDNARLYELQLKTSRSLERALLPPTLPDIPGLDLAAAYHPGQIGLEVGGDFYDAFDVGDWWALVIGDVCGRGSDAAALTALARHTIRTAAMRESRPSEILRVLNEAMLRDAEDERFCSVLLVRVEPSRRGALLTVCRAGHPPALIRRANGRMTRLQAGGTVLGIMEEDLQLVDERAELEPDDVLVLYTDGVIERRRVGGAVFGTKRLERALRSDGGVSAASVIGRIETALLGFAELGHDDSAILVARATR